jgi:hypothetical protein
VSSAKGAHNVAVDESAARDGSSQKPEMWCLISAKSSTECISMDRVTAETDEEGESWSQTGSVWAPEVDDFSSEHHAKPAPEPYYYRVFSIFETLALKLAQ